MGAGTDGLRRPSHLRWSQDPGLGFQAQQRIEPAGPSPPPRAQPPGDLSLVYGAPPVVVATGRCRGNQSDSHPGLSGARRCSRQLGALVPTLALPTSDSGPGKAQRERTSQRDSCGDLGPRRRPFWDGTKCWNAPPAHSLLLAEAETTTPNMPCGGGPTPVRQVAQGAHGSCSSLLFGGLNGCTGGRGRLGRLGASAERTVGPRRHVSGAPNPGASSVRRASGLQSHQPRPR